MKPKQWIRYVKRIEKRNMAICDGLSYESNIFDILYPLFIATGISLFLIIIIKWDYIKNIIKR